MSEETTYNYPSSQCLQHCVKLSIVDDRPIMMDYWTDSQEGKVLIGVRDGGEKLLVKSEDEYTSPISKIYKIEGEYIIVTENSLYIVSADISTRKIT
jgi:hypothetical protein|tara:strand:+ start:228 stop:518 length:291 start_codon:yes stop_codon:yes gene_type:complete